MSNRSESLNEVDDAYQQAESENVFPTTEYDRFVLLRDVKTLSGELIDSLYANIEYSEKSALYWSSLHKNPAVLLGFLQILFTVRGDGKLSAESISLGLQAARMFEQHKVPDIFKKDLIKYLEAVVAADAFKNVAAQLGIFIR